MNRLQLFSVLRATRFLVLFSLVASLTFAAAGSPEGARPEKSLARRTTPPAGRSAGAAGVVPYSAPRRCAKLPSASRGSPGRTSRSSAADRGRSRLMPIRRPGDFIDGEDLTIRRAAVDALGPYNGSVVVVDPQ